MWRLSSCTFLAEPAAKWLFVWLPVPQVATFSSTPPPPPLSSPLNPDCSFHRLSRPVPVCLCLWPQAVSACSQRLNLHVCVHTEWMLCVCLRAEFGGHICGFASLLRLQDFEAESGEWEMISDLTPLFAPPPCSFFYAPHKMQLVRELIPPPAEL